METPASGTRSTSAKPAKTNRKRRSTRAGAKLCPVPSGGDPGHDGPIRLQPPKLATMTEDQFMELVDLLAEMLSGGPEAKAYPFRRAA